MTGSFFSRQGYKGEKKSKTSISSKHFSRQSAASPKTFNPQEPSRHLRCHPGVSQETIHRHVEGDKGTRRAEHILKLHPARPIF